MVISALRWRSFGTRADLDVDFVGSARYAIVTRLLAACRADAEVDPSTRSAQAGALTIAGRIGALAALIAQSSTQALSVRTRCVRAECRDAIELDLPLDWIVEQADRAEGAPVIDVALADGNTVRLRRPTGNDQRHWAERQYDSPTQAQHAVLQSLTESTDSIDQHIDAIAEQLEHADPLPALRVRSTCPACGQLVDRPVDVEALLLAELHRQQSELLRDVHRLATRYGWSESTVAELPPWRRQAYLALGARDG